MASMFGTAPILAVDPGEGTKSLAGFGRVLEFLGAQNLDRGGVLFAMGGGVVGEGLDAGGWTSHGHWLASTWSATRSGSSAAHPVTSAKRQPPTTTARPTTRNPAR